MIIGTTNDCGLIKWQDGTFVIDGFQEPVVQMGWLNNYAGHGQVWSELFANMNFTGWCDG